MKLEEKVRINEDLKEVVMSLKDFKELIRYVNELKSANDKLNQQIKEYNERFTND